MAKTGHAFRVKRLHAGDPPDSFPDPLGMGTVLGYPDGLLAIGGDLSPARLLAAYRQGIFPWFNSDQPILWWSPEPRAVIDPARFHMSRSLARTLRRGGWEYSRNEDFAAVIRGCATGRGEHGTWITPSMEAAYLTMHTLGYAHSLESWHNGELAGGIYGIRLGSVFFGESMFSARPGGSKVAISALVQTCLDNGITLIDCQLPSGHLASLGMQEMSRDAFTRLVQAETESARPLAGWHAGRTPAEGLARLRSIAP